MGEGAYVGNPRDEKIGLAIREQLGKKDNRTFNSISGYHSLLRFFLKGLQVSPLTGTSLFGQPLRVEPCHKIQPTARKDQPKKTTSGRYRIERPEPKP